MSDRTRHIIVAFTGVVVLAAMLLALHIVRKVDAWLNLVCGG